jgi:uncharacterized membrane protein YvlD (DUF360 family)
VTLIAMLALSLGFSGLGAYHLVFIAAAMSHDASSSANGFAISEQWKPLLMCIVLGVWSVFWLVFAFLQLRLLLSKGRRASCNTD